MDQSSILPRSNDAKVNSSSSEDDRLSLHSAVSSQGQTAYPSQPTQTSRPEHLPKRSMLFSLMPVSEESEQSDQPERLLRHQSAPQPSLPSERAQPGSTSQPVQPGRSSQSPPNSPPERSLQFEQKLQPSTPMQLLLQEFETTRAISTAKPNIKNKHSKAARCCLLLSLFMLLLVAAVIAAMAIRSATLPKLPVSPPFCCSDVMEYLNRTVSFGVDPCRNFHAFVCGGSDAEWRGSILDRAYQAIFINVSLELHLGETIGKSEAMVTLMRFYRSCLRPADSPLEADRQAVAFLKHINETSGLLASNATQGMLFQLITLMSLRYNIPTILSINLVSIGGSNGSVSLTFALGPSLETRWGGEMAYFRYSIIRMLLWTNTYLHSNVTIDMIDRMEMSLNLGPPDAYKSFTNTSIEEIADIIIGVSPRAFRYHISSSLPKGIEFNELANIQSSNTSVIKIAMNTFFQPNQRVVAVTLALINVFAAILDQLISLQYRKKWPHWYFHYCEMEALSFRETWRLASLEYIPQNGTLIVQQIKKDVTRAALKQLVGHCGAKYKLWHLVHDKVTKLRIRMPEENVYRDIALPTMTPNFVLNYIALKRYSQEVKVRRAQTRMSEGIMDDEKLGFRYFPEENSVYLTPSWFQQPMFYPKSEPFVNYAVIGAILAGLTHRAVGRSGQNHDANGNEKRWWTHNLDVAIAEQQNCFRREYIDVSDGEPSPSLLDEIWAISEGLELVWEDVVASGLDDGNVQINGKTFTWRQFFFIRFCSVWCNYAGTPAENAWRCNVPLKHIPGFAYSFNCSGAKAMGYRHSCSRKLPCS